MRGNLQTLVPNIEAVLNHLKRKLLEPIGAMAVNEMNGFGWLLELIKNDLQTESDIIVAITHWLLITQLGFRCIGNGNEVI